jgi:hypothetical protein
MEDFGFIMIRNVSDAQSDRLWKECYRCIRKFYNNKIVIVDTGSNKEFITDLELVNCEIIYELLPKKMMMSAYYHMYTKKLFKKAVFLQDSAFIQEYIDFTNIDNKFLWHFEHIADQPDKELRLLHLLDNSELLIHLYYYKKIWKGCFGIMTVLTWDFIDILNTKYGFMKLYDIINCWEDWMAFERVMAVLCTFENMSLCNEPSVLGDVFENIYRWGYTMDEYLEEKNHRFKIIKVFSTRK